MEEDLNRSKNPYHREKKQSMAEEDFQQLNVVQQKTEENNNQ